MDELEAFSKTSQTRVERGAFFLVCDAEKGIIPVCWWGPYRQQAFLDDLQMYMSDLYTYTYPGSYQILWDS